MKISIQTLLACCLVAASTSAYAQMTYEATGGNAFVPSWTESVALPDGNTLVRTVSHGFTWANDEDVVGGNGSMSCYASLTMNPDGMPVAGSGTCDVLDLEGDTWRLWWDGAVGGNWGMTVGTGKYAGITGGGTWKQQARYADGNWMNEWTGSWTIPAHEMEGMKEME